MGDKWIIFSSHARFEMNRRGITTGAVVNTIRCPGQMVPSIKGRQIRQSLIGTKRHLLLRVVVKETPTAYYVLTAYKTSKVAKYWVMS